MAKRSAGEAFDGNEVYLKRQKLTTGLNLAQNGIHNGAQLRQALAFDQDLRHAKQGIQTFKSFLDNFSEPEADHTHRTNILKEFLDSQIPADKDDLTAVYLADVMQTWSYASQSNNESLLSAVPAVLALLLRTISGILDLAPHGLRLGRTLLQKRQLELISRGLKSNKSKDFLISPVLRLLREIVLFDGGVLAKQVFRARDHVFQNLPRNLNLRSTTEEGESRKKPSIRTNAVRFVLALLRLLTTDLKKEFIMQRDIVSALTKDVKDDPSFVVCDLLDTLKTSILQDEGLPRESKIKIINAQLLSRLSMLFRYDIVDDEATETSNTIQSMSHDLLMMACTSSTSGVLNRQTGYYPRGVDPNETYDFDLVNGNIDLGLDTVEWADHFADKVPVRNTILSEFVQSLRPWSDTKQCELLLAIFDGAPELIADYFINKSSFSFEPKLTSTWIGYSALIFSSINVSVPQYFGQQGEYARLPPPTAVVIENILPRPLTQKVLKACLLHEQSLITFFAVRILSIAFLKLKTVLKMYDEASSGSRSIWTQAAERLSKEFCDRCPSIKDVIFAYRKIAQSNVLQREASSRLLVLYHEMAPRLALEAKFDVSEALAKALTAANRSDLQLSERELRIIELENLFRFAHLSPGMKWFNQTTGFDLSPFTTMLKLAAEAPREIPLINLKSVLQSVVTENDVLQHATAVSPLEALILSIRNSIGDSQSCAVYKFLDRCAGRCASKPVNYIFTLEEATSITPKSDDQNASVSLLNFAIAEQWPFLVKAAEEAELLEVSRFLSQHFARSIKIKEDESTLKSLVEGIIGAAANIPVVQTTLKEALSLVKNIEVPRVVVKAQQQNVLSNTNKPSESDKTSIANTLLQHTSNKTEDHNGLVRWTTKDVDEAIEEGHVAALIMLLSSKHLSVRKEATTNIAKFNAKLKESVFAEKDQIWLLLCELNETAKKSIDQSPLLTVISAFAAHALPVLIDPLHCLYPKINTFLSQGPSWETTKIPLLYKVLDEAPSLDDARYTEMSWLLTYILAGLQTQDDMNVYRKRRVFEKVFSAYNNPYLGSSLKEKILRLLFRGAMIEGGSTTLITRFSTMTWLQVQIALTGGVALKVLMEDILQRADKRRVNHWSSNGLESIVQEAVEY